MNEQISTARWKLSFTGLVAATNFFTLLLYAQNKVAGGVGWTWNPFWGIIFGGQHRRGGVFFQMPWHFWLTATQPGRRANKLLVTLLCHASCAALWSQAKVVLSRRCNMQKMDQAGRKKESVLSELLLMGTQTCEWLICASRWPDQLLLALPALLGVGRELQESVFKSQEDEVKRVRVTEDRSQSWHCSNFPLYFSHETILILIIVATYWVPNMG